MSGRSRSPACSAIAIFGFGGSWRGDHPHLIAWLDNFAARVPAFARNPSRRAEDFIRRRPAVEKQQRASM